MVEAGAHAAALEERIEEVDPHSIRHNFDGAPFWVRQSASQIALIAGDSPVLYLDHSMQPYDNPLGQVIAVTRDVVILVAADDSRVSPSAVSRVFSRKEITSLIVDNVQGSPDSDEEWPYSLRVQLDLAGQHIALPFHPHNSKVISALVSILPELAADARGASLSNAVRPEG